MNIWFNGSATIHSIYAPYCVKEATTINGVNCVSNPSQALNKYTSRIFKKVVCCGDSYTSGHMTDPDGVVHPSMEDYAWPHYMSTITGNDWVNCGVSGASVLSWQTNTNGLAKAQRIGKAQAYIVGLMINDNGDWGGFVELGTSSDIGTNAQTYYGGLSQIVEKLHAINTDAKIFLCTCPRTAEGFPERNQAVKDVCSHYADTHNTHCLDLLANMSLYQNSSLTGDSHYGHQTAIGYEQFAEILNEILSDYINTHISEFQNVPFIEYD
jgi:hypothetical protein